MLRHRGLTLIEVLVIVAIVLIICAIAIPGLLSSRRDSNERGAVALLKALGSAEADFRANDRDGNGVNDYWTGDVKGLYTMTSAKVVGAGVAPVDPPIRLIDVSTAAADADGTLVPAGGENMELRTFAAPAPVAGYWFVALLNDLSDKPEEAPYKRDTGGTPSMGRCHNMFKVGIVAFPDSYSAGRTVFRMNEIHGIYRETVPVQLRPGTEIPPGLEGVPRKYLDWPADRDLKFYWTAVD